MKAKILEKSGETKWDEFIKNHPLSTIHQTPAWGRFQEKIPSRGKYWIIALEENEKIIGGTMLIRHELPYGFTWLYCARGPLINYDSPNQMQLLLEAIKPIAKQENAVFLRIDPPLETASRKTQLPPGFKKTSAGFQPDHTLILDLAGPEDKILARMKPKGRYNIRLAEKKGIKIRIADPKSQQFEKDITTYHEILKETATRDGFHGHRKGFYRTMIKTLGNPAETPGKDQPLARLYLAEYEGRVIAATIVTFFSSTATYYYGVSSNEYRNVMAPYLLQWQAIRDAKSQGFKHYDFLGISPQGAKNHPWKGVTEFKKKFGGKEVHYQKAREFSFKPLFHLLYRLHKR